MIKQHIYHFFKFILSKRLSNGPRVSEVLLFSEFMNIVSILFYNFIEFIILLYTFLVISFAGYKEYRICLISFSTFSDVLPACTCARAIDNLWSICVGVNILNPLPFFTSYAALKPLKNHLYKYKIWWPNLAHHKGS